MKKVCSLHPKKLQRAYQRIEETIASWTQDERDDLFNSIIPLKRKQEDIMATATKEAPKPQASTGTTAVTVKPYDTMRHLFQDNMKVIQQACAKTVTAEKMARMMLTEMMRNPELAECSKASVMGFMLQSAQLGLEPGPLGHVYPVPFKNNKRNGRLECQLIVGYKGLLELCRRSEQISTVAAQAVHEQDKFEYQYGTEQILVHKPAMRERGKILFYYAMSKLKDGGYQFEVMSYEDIMAHKNKFSKAKSDGPWINNEPEMCKKTVLRRLCKLLPQTTELATAVALDEAADVDTQNLGALPDIPQGIRDLPSQEDEREAEELREIHQGMANGNGKVDAPVQDESAASETASAAPSSGPSAGGVADSEFAEEEKAAPKKLADITVPPDDAHWRRCVEYLDMDADRMKVKETVKKTMTIEKLGRLTGQQRVGFMNTVGDFARKMNVRIEWPA